MRAMTNPTQNGGAVFGLCVSSIGNAMLEGSLAGVTNLIDAMCIEYNIKALTADLYLIAPDHSANETVYLGAASKKEFKNVYSQQMVGAGKPGRTIYDALLASAPGGKCPLCGYGQAKTLDHYLPKARYPQFSVFPSNLVPACYDCNVGKRTIVAVTKGEQSIHPYYDAGLISEQWLFAEVIEGSPLTIRYFAAPPEHWNVADKARVQSHFETLNFQKRFSVEAADELASVRDTILRHSARFGADHIKADLLATAADRYEIHKNSWQTALHQALGNSDWYCSGGFREI